MAIGPVLEEGTCDRCGLAATRPLDSDTRFVCVLCRKLGDRSLVWYMKRMRNATSEGERRELRARFRAARGRSLMYDDVVQLMKRGKKLPPGLRQWANEKERGVLPSA